MTVYVDDVRHQFGRMICCHLWADSLDELHAAAAAIGMQRRWFQQPPKASWCHYDISLGKKEMAIKNGAVLTDKYGPVEYEARRRIATGVPAQVERGERQLASVAVCRAMRKSPVVDPVPFALTA